MRAAWLQVRDGEVRLGEVLSYRDETTAWKEAKYHILGVKECVGPLLNGGRAGAEFAFDAFIGKFLNTQSNEFIDGSSICIHGFLAIDDVYELNEQLVLELDTKVCNWAKSVTEVGGIPILVGGGHNNAFPIIQGVSQAKKQAIAVMNMDPHADVRKTGSRHSGNSFSYAFEAGFLNRYSVLGLHQGYNNQFILNQLKSMNASVYFFENWLDSSIEFEKNINFVFDEFSNANQFFGLELDMDSIEYMPSSAFTPSGITVNQARFYIRKMAKCKPVAYLNLTEAAPTTPEEVLHVGKALSYLVTDFIKQHQSNQY